MALKATFDSKTRELTLVMPLTEESSAPISGSGKSKLLFTTRGFAYPLSGEHYGVSINIIKLVK